MAKTFTLFIWLSFFITVALSAAIKSSAQGAPLSPPFLEDPPLVSTPSSAPIQEKIAVPIRPTGIVPTLVPVPKYTPKNSDAVIIIAGVAAVSGAALAMFILHQNPR